MGRNLPSERGNALDWITERLATWADNAAAIGLDAADVAAVASATAQADTARTAAGAARASSKSKTQDYYDKADAAIEGARDLILTVKAFAASSDDPQVYVLADLSPIAPRGETPAPDAPSDVNTTLLPDGGLQLNWKGKGPQGTFYIITRQLAGETAFTTIATVTDKSFTDSSIPFGTDQVLYQIRAQQTDKVTQGPIVTVRLGVGNASQSGQQGGQSEAA